MQDSKYEGHRESKDSHEGTALLQAHWPKKENPSSPLTNKELGSLAAFKDNPKVWKDKEGYSKYMEQCIKSFKIEDNSSKYINKMINENYKNDCIKENLEKSILYNIKKSEESSLKYSISESMIEKLLDGKKFFGSFGDSSWYISGPDTLLDNSALRERLLAGRGGIPDSEGVFRSLMDEATHSSVLYRGLHFGRPEELNAFLRAMHDGKVRNRCASLTVFLGVAKSFAGVSPGSGQYSIILALDPTKLKLRRVNYSNPDSKDYEPSCYLPEGEVRTDDIPPDAVRGVMIYNTKSQNLDGSLSFLGVPDPTHLTTGINNPNN